MSTPSLVSESVVDSHRVQDCEKVCRSVDHKGLTGNIEVTDGFRGSFVFALECRVCLL